LGNGDQLAGRHKLAEAILAVVGDEWLVAEFHRVTLEALEDRVDHVDVNGLVPFGTQERQDLTQSMQLALDRGHDGRRDTPAAGGNRVDGDLGVHRGGEHVVSFLANVVEGEDCATENATSASTNTSHDRTPRMCETKTV
jgi:hypothetical protein